MERRKVTMVTLSAAPDGTTQRHEATDYVPVDAIDAYVADARKRWQAVTVGEEEDHGPGGAKGLCVVPAHLDHPLAGQTTHGA